MQSIVEGYSCRQVNRHINGSRVTWGEHSGSLGQEGADGVVVEHVQQVANGVEGAGADGLLRDAALAAAVAAAC